MAAVLSVEALEGSTYVVTAAFTDEDDNAVVPSTVTWTLTDSGGDVVDFLAALAGQRRSATAGRG